MSDLNQDQDEAVVPDELATLKDRANRLGIQFHPQISLEKLRVKVNEKINEPVGSDTPVTTAPVEPVAETLHQKRLRIKREALALVRIRVTCMNPAKKESDGEVLTTGNQLIGTVRKFIPFNNDEGWHVPAVLLNMLRERMCQQFYSEKDSRGNSVRKSKLIKEFAIEVLPDLTKDELDELARRQAASHAIG